MKVAIILPGRPRQIKVGYESLKYYLDRHDCDVFIHTWFDKKFKSDIYGQFIDLFKPKKFLAEEQIIFDVTNRKDPNWNYPLQLICSQYYSLYMTNLI
jgi:hypothetical protein